MKPGDLLRFRDPELWTTAYHLRDELSGRTCLIISTEMRDTITWVTTLVEGRMLFFSASTLSALTEAIG